MNTIAMFRKCTLTNEELVQKVDKLTDKMYLDRRIPDRQIPARPNDDYDLLIGELLIRFNSLIEVVKEQDESTSKRIWNLFWNGRNKNEKVQHSKD
jgi:hypothetical protein